MKYKEIRMVILFIIIDILIVSMMIYFGITGNKSKLIIGSVFLVITLPLILMKYNCHIFNDSTLIYSLKSIGIMPSLIYFKDIKEYQLLTKHQLLITTKKKYKVYVIDANAFYEELDNNIKEFKSINEEKTK